MSSQLVSYLGAQQSNMPLLKGKNKKGEKKTAIGTETEKQPPENHLDCRVEDICPPAVQTLLLHLQSIHGVDTQQLEPTSNFPNYLPSLILSQPAMFSKALIRGKFHHRIASSRKYMQKATA